MIAYVCTCLQDCSMHNADIKPIVKSVEVELQLLTIKETPLCLHINGKQLSSETEDCYGFTTI